MNTLTKARADVAPFELDGEEFAPRDERERFRIYSLEPCRTCHGTGTTDASLGARCGDCRGKGQTLCLLATTPTPEGVGTFIVQHALDEWEHAQETGGTYAAPSSVGVLDGLAHRWLLSPWVKRG